MNILYVHSTPLDSEMANLVQVLNMCDAFCSIGHSVTLITRKSEKEEANCPQYISGKFGMDASFDLRFFEGGFSVFGKMKDIGALFSNFRKLIREEMRKKQVDLIMIRNPIFLTGLPKDGVCVVYELHNHIVHYEYKLLNFFWEKILLHKIGKGRVSKVVVISEALKVIWARKGIQTASMVACHDGFNPAQFRIEVTKQDARRRLGMPVESKIAVYTGSLYVDRGIELILAAAKKMPHVLFYVVGGPTAMAVTYRGLATAQKITNMVFAGRLDQKAVSTYLFAADALLLIFTDKVPTINYCSPLKLFEYMASGRTIVGHAFPTIKEVLVDGQDALLADPKNEAELMEKLKLALVSGDGLGRAARGKAFELYTWEQRAKTIVEFALVNEDPSSKSSVEIRPAI